MDEGEFARLGLSRQGGPSHSIQKVEECLKAARAAGDAVEGPVSDSVGGWCAHHVICGFMMHFLPLAPVIDYGIPREEPVNQVSWFCLRGMGLTEEAIGRRYQSQGASRPETTAACSAPVDAASSPSHEALRFPFPQRREVTWD